MLHPCFSPAFVDVRRVSGHVRVDSDNIRPEGAHSGHSARRPDRRGVALGVTALCAVAGWKIGLLAAFVHVNVYLAGSAAVNAIGHHFGRRPYDNNAGNLQWLAFVTAGEGLHNNHHAKPTAAKLSHRWFEIDLGWWLIKTLTWLRLARLRVMSGTGVRGQRPAARPARAPAPAASS